jgi:hypothetical protein
VLHEGGIEEQQLLTFSDVIGSPNHLIPIEKLLCFSEWYVVSVRPLGGAAHKATTFPN